MPSTNTPLNEEAATETGFQTPCSTGNSEVILKWDNLSYEVKSKDNKQTEWRTILNRISGEVRAGESIAIIGSSGAGKTTLLNALSGRIVGGRLSGQILFGGQRRHPSNFKRLTAYVQQDDLMHPLLTVQETLAYAARLRLPSDQYSEQQKMERTNNVIRRLRLEAARNTKIGDHTTRGVSGGERKRVSIGTELLTDPRLLFLDEPTSGLDSNSSELVVELIKQIAVDNGIATMTTIHQPSARIFNIFDKVILLSQGRIVYFGPTATSIDYFASIGYQCPVHENPADYYIDIMTLDYRNDEALEKSKNQIKELADKFAEQHPPMSLGSSPDGSTKEAALLDDASPTASIDRAPSRNNWLYEYVMLARRDWLNVCRNVPFLISQVVQAIFMGLLIGFMFFYLGHDSLSIQNRMGVLFIIAINSTFPVIMPSLNLYYRERDIMVRERSSATYRVSSFFVSKVTTFAPIALVANAVFFIGVYFISHLVFDAGKFFISLATFACMIIVSVAFLLMVGSGVKSQEIGFVVAPTVLTLQLMFGGMLANPSTITPVLRWIRWVNPVFYGYSSMVQNEFSGMTFECTQDSQCYQNGNEVIDAYAMGRFTNWQNILFLIMLAVVDLFAGYVMLRWLAKPKYIWL